MRCQELEDKLEDPNEHKGSLGGLRWNMNLIKLDKIGFIFDTVVLFEKQ